MTIGEVFFASLIDGEDDDRDLDLAALAARLGQADEKGWKKFFRDRE
ncbi:hypothetical protein [Fulvimarina manganoxydans]|nr:hypothetical protein [Fulvimarina manganoxydans]